MLAIKIIFTAFLGVGLVSAVVVISSPDTESKCIYLKSTNTYRCK